MPDYDIIEIQQLPPVINLVNDMRLPVQSADGITSSITLTQLIALIGGGGGLKELVIAVGDAPTLLDGRTPDYTYPDGTTEFTIPELIGYIATGVRVGNLPYSPEDMGYSLDSVLGKMIFADPLNACNIYLHREAFGVVPGEQYLVTIDGQLITTINGENLTIL